MRIITENELENNIEDMFRVGAITTTHGIRGEVKVYPTTDDPMRFKQLKEVFLDTKKELLPLTVTNVRFFKNLVIVKFKEFDNINDIEGYKGCDLYVTRENAVPLEEGEYYLADIMDSQVFTEDGAQFGTLVDILETPANLVYVVEHEGKEVLLPVIPDCVLEVDPEEKRIVIQLMKGLLEE